MKTKSRTLVAVHGPTQAAVGPTDSRWQVPQRRTRQMRASTGRVANARRGGAWRIPSISAAGSGDGRAEAMLRPQKRRTWTGAAVSSPASQPRRHGQPLSRRLAPVSLAFSLVSITAASSAIQPRPWSRSSSAEQVQEMDQMRENSLKI